MAVTIVEEARPITGGVDTHADTHVAAALDSVGGLLGSGSSPPPRRILPSAGLAGRVRNRVPGRDRRDRQLRRRAGPPRHRGWHPGRRGGPLGPPGPRRQGKSDPLDAVSAARAAQSGRARGAPKGRDGAVEAIRALMVARRSAAGERTRTINQARALILTGPMTCGPVHPAHPGRPGRRARLAAAPSRRRRGLCRPGSATGTGTARTVPGRPARPPGRSHRPAGHRPRPGPARPVRDRAPHRGAAAHRRRGPSRAAPLRGGLGAPVRRRPDPRIIGESHPPPAQPRW